MRNKKDSLPILVVDDEPDFVLILKIRLEKLGYRVETAYNGEEAIKKALIETPLILITDLAMPIQDGAETIYMFKQSDQLKDVPTIVLSAIDNDLIKKVSNWAGADYYLVKPYNIEELERIISVISQKRLVSFE
jgi:two-component system alkaline phosphatase synthesis response regulator PhoP